MNSWQQTRDIINDFIEKLAIEHNPVELYAPITYTLSQSGKRVRPVLFLMAYNMYKDNVGDVLYPAVAMETYHNHTLLHDDVMDNADIRRGMPTVAAKWGSTPAILSGDTMLLLAYEFMAHVPDDKLREMLSLMTVTAKEVCEGQQFDIEFETRDDVREEEYMEMIRLKTSVLLAACVKMGGIMAGASESDCENLYAYGETMGLAFQLQDDLLDVYGDEKTFGKKIGGDIVCNKKTFMLIKCLELASPSQRAELEEWIAKKDFDEAEKIAFVTNLYNTLGIKGICEERIQALFAKCDEYISNVSVAEDKKVELRAFVNTLLGRTI